MRFEDTLIAKGINIMNEKFNTLSGTKMNQATKYFNILVKDDIILSVAESNVEEAKKNLEQKVTTLEHEEIRLERYELTEEDSLDQHKKVISAYNAVVEAREALRIAETQLEAVEKVFLGTEYLESRIANETRLQEVILQAQEEEAQKTKSYSRAKRNKQKRGFFSFLNPTDRKH